MTALSKDLTPAPLMELCSGFWVSQALAAAVELDLFSELARSGPLSFEELAGRLGLEERPADMLFAVLASVGLLERRDGTCANNALSEAFLVRGSRYYFGGWIEYASKREYPAWGELTTALRENRPTTWDPATQESLFSDVDPFMLERFWEAMHSLSTFTARALAEAVDFGNRRRVLDVGGGSGAYPIELCRAYPQLEATVFDQPHVCEIAARKVAEAELSERIATTAGDFAAETPLPHGHDVIVLSMIMHDWDEQDDRRLLRKCYEALDDDGIVVISEQLLDDQRNGPPAAALMGLNMIVETGAGRNYAVGEYTSWLYDTGFARVEHVQFTAPGANGVVIGFKRDPVS